ncbi:CshA/CshB family fibrillar adhesin-related protein [Xinfangfangia sp. CPCC 101601]|uniref:CshA/CshB family fibrillar adhesin-related protein n=1 Tax=Pseudogemmobacter lacusdianii TaxID=3069608 RepID=A0ABU0VYN6_9RHOB|nr:DUF11 domain-containing protein [Xinfangfangia sp. CPCC 101601]MDQ2066842.1 CshA/CshB family fibrillar adhesin-related protein [Xinfangfangia sp. CPCC 101601]
MTKPISSRLVSLRNSVKVPLVALATLVGAAQPALTDQLSFATTGVGKYRNEIAWFSWKSSGVSITNGYTFRGNFDVAGDRVTAECGISNLTKGADRDPSLPTSATPRISSYRPGAWTADSLPFLYGQGSANSNNSLNHGIVTVLDRQRVSFDVKCAAKRADGSNFPLAGLVLADAETFSYAEEKIGVRIGANKSFYLIESYKNDVCNTQTGWKSANAQSYEFSYISGTRDCKPSGNAVSEIGKHGNPVFVGFTDATSVGFDLWGYGYQAIAIGVLMPSSDFSDAPSVYGSSGFVFDRQVVGERLPQSSSARALPKDTRQDGATASGVYAGLSAPRLALGRNATYESRPLVIDQDADDAFSSALPALGAADSLYSVNGTCTGPVNGNAVVHAWLDVNADGQFDPASEYRTAVCVVTQADASLGQVVETVPGQGGSTTVTRRYGRGTFTLTDAWTAPLISTEKAAQVAADLGGNTFLRLMIAPEGVTVAPTGTNWNVMGEVEDWAVPYQQNDADMVPVVGPLTLDGTASPQITPEGIVYNGTVTCTNKGPGAALDPTCSVTAAIGTIEGLTCTPDLAAQPGYSLAKDAAITCGFTYRLTAAEAQQANKTQETLTGVTSSVTETAPTKANNAAKRAIPVALPQINVKKVLLPFIVPAAELGEGQTEDLLLFRDSASDQFMLSITGAGVNASVVTPGAESPLGDSVLSRNVPAAVPYTIAEQFGGGANPNNYLSDISCLVYEGETLVGQTPAAGDVPTPPESRRAWVVTPLYGQRLDCTVTNTYAPSADLVTKKVIEGRDPAALLQDHDVVTYKITVENKGPATARLITLNDSLPAALVPAGGNGAVTYGTYDAAADGLWSIPELAPGATATLTLRGAVPANLGGETIVNVTTAARSALYEDPNTEGDILTVESTVEEKAGVSLVKTARVVDYNNDGQIGLGDRVAYSFEVSNTGNSKLVNLQIFDAPLGGDTPVWTLAELAVGQNVTVDLDPEEFGYPLTVEDFDATSVRNQARVEAFSRSYDPQDPGPVVTDLSGTAMDNDTPTVTPLPPRPSLRLVKSATLLDLAEPLELPAAGDVLEYRFTLTNTGNQTLTNLAISDAKLGSAPIQVLADPERPEQGGGLTLAPGESVTLPRNESESALVRYLLTQADFNGGTVSNTATATGQSPSGIVVTDISGLTNNDNLPTISELPQIAKYELVKTGTLPRVVANPAHETKAGDPVVFTLKVTNIGNLTLTGLRVEDPMFVPQLVGVIATLQPGESVNVTAETVLTQAQIDAGQILNTARVSGTRPGGSAVPPAEGSTTVSVPQRPKLTLEKTAVSPLTVQELGEVVTFDLKVTNSGNTSFVGAITIDDPTATSVSCPALPLGRLAPGASVNCLATQAATQADLNAEAMVNIATAKGTTAPIGGAPTGTTVTSEPGEASVPVIRRPALALEKAAVWTETSYFAPGTEVPYTFTVTNTGNVTLNGVMSIRDNLIPTVSCPALPAEGLAPGATLVCEGLYLLNVGDVAVGSVTNNATAHFENPETGETATSIPSSYVVPPNAKPALSLIKELIEGDGFDEVGDRLVWKFTVTNTGNVSFASDVIIHDPLLGGDLVCHDSRNGTVSLDPFSLVPLKGRAVCEAVYEVTQADLDAGKVLNTAYASSIFAPRGSDPIFVESPSAQDEAEAVQRGAISLTKEVFVEEGEDTSVAKGVGERLSWKIVATNSGNVTLRNLRVTDPQLADLTCEPANTTELAPKASLVCIGSEVILQSHVDQSLVSNTANTSATTPSGSAVHGTATETYKPEAPAPALTLVKTSRYIDSNSNGFADVGDQILFGFTVENTGNVTLGQVTVSDVKLSPSIVAQNLTLAPGQSQSFSRLMPLTQAHIDAQIPADSEGLQVFDNSATATAVDPNNTPVRDTSGNSPDDDDPTRATFDPKPATAW